MNTTAWLSLWWQWTKHKQSHTAQRERGMAVVQHRAGEATVKWESRLDA